MILSLRKKIAITLSEAMITMVIFGVIALIVTQVINYENPTKKGNATLARKTSVDLEQAAMQIITNNSTYDNFLNVKDKDGYFSIEDSDAKDRLSVLFKDYMIFLDLKIDLGHEYYSTELRDVHKKNLGITLKDTYTGYFWNQNGGIVGFRFYEGCNNTELNANPPDYKGVYSVENVCGSVFYDVNGYKKPNLVGSDQFILPINKYAIIYSNE